MSRISFKYKWEEHARTSTYEFFCWFPWILFEAETRIPWKILLHNLMKHISLLWSSSLIRLCFEVFEEFQAKIIIQKHWRWPRKKLGWYVCFKIILNHCRCGRYNWLDKLPSHFSLKHSRACKTFGLWRYSSMKWEFFWNAVHSTDVIFLLICLNRQCR